MRAVRHHGHALVVGAMATHHVVAHDPLLAEHAGVLSGAAASIGDPQIRYRGTIGGALAHADPAGDIAPALLALEASVELTGSRGPRSPPVAASLQAYVTTGSGGPRSLPVADFLEDYFTTALGEDEVLTSIRIPKHTGWGMHYEKFTQVAQSWAIVAVAAVVRVDAGTVAEVRLGMSNMGST